MTSSAASSATHGRGFMDVSLGLLGRHQAANAAVAMATVEELRRYGWTISEAAIRKGLAEVVWPARVEVVSRRPTVVLDAAHNMASIGALVEVLEESFSVRKRFLVFATTLEKDVGGMLDLLLGRFDHVIFTRYVENPRGVPPEELLSMARAKNGENFEIAATPSEAWAVVHRMARPEDLICITGSFFLASEMRRAIAERPLKDAQ